PFAVEYHLQPQERDLRLALIGTICMHIHKRTLHLSVDTATAGHLTCRRRAAGFAARQDQNTSWHVRSQYSEVAWAGRGLATPRRYAASMPCESGKAPG